VQLAEPWLGLTRDDPHSLDEVGYLKSGLIQAMVVQKPAQEAVISLERMAALLRNGTTPNPKVLLLSPVVATQADMNNPSISQWFYR
jgi:ABC-type sugar transport system substrate-binding protein